MTMWKMPGCLGVLGAVICVPAVAAGPLDALMACRNLADASARLACFDREAAALDAKSATVVAPGSPPSSAAPVVSPEPTRDPKQQFGLPVRTVITQEIAAGTRPSEATKIEAHVVRLAPGVDGRLVLTLDNEQVWRQVVSSGEMLLKAGDAVTISRAMLGSYWLQTTTGRGCKVSRIH